MVIWLVLPGAPRRRCNLDVDIDAATTEGPCPHCGRDATLVVRGKSPRPSADDRAYEAVAVARCCGADVGTLRTEVATLFGVREDMAVMNGPWRVY